MKMEFRVSIEEALDWECGGRTLRQAITDRAVEELGQFALDADFVIKIEIDHESFVAKIGG